VRKLKEGQVTAPIPEVADAGGLDQRVGAGSPAAREIVEHDNVSGAELGDETLLDQVSKASWLMGLFGVFDLNSYSATTLEYHEKLHPCGCAENELL
jgi:hypothetical protein